MRGAPINAKSSKTWTSQFKPFGSPVQRTLPGTAHNAPQFVAQDQGSEINGELGGYAKSAGDFNAGGQPRGPIQSPRWKP